MLPSKEIDIPQQENTETATSTEIALEAPKTPVEAPKPIVRVIPHVDRSEITATIALYATQYGVSSDYLVGVASCESSLNPKAYNPVDTDGLPAIGLFQYKAGTWTYFGTLSGLPHDNIWDAHQQAQLTAWAFSTGYARHWGCA